jgi:hypothetical protein
MRRIPIRATLLTGLVILLALPVGFAVAQVVQDQPSGEIGEWRHLDPDPSSDPIEMGERLRAARESGDTTELDGVLEEIHEEALSHLSPDERAAAEAAPPAPSVPEGTKAYIPPSVPSVLVDGCAKKISEGNGDALCELAVLHAEGRVRSGAFSAEEITEILGSQKRGEAR